MPSGPAALAHDGGLDGERALGARAPVRAGRGLEERRVIQVGVPAGERDGDGLVQLEI